MNVWEVVLLGLVLWTAIGGIGTLVALARGDRPRAWRGLRSLAVVWLVYLAVEYTAARMQRQKVLALGQEQCFDDLCFAVDGVEEVQGFYGRNRGERAEDGSRLLRVTVRVRNKGLAGSQSEGALRAYVVDAQGREWHEVPGLSGVPLTTAVAAGGQVLSEPVYRVSGDASGLGLVLTHGHRQPGRLVIGDSDSVGHLPTIMTLGR